MISQRQLITAALFVVAFVCSGARSASAYPDRAVRIIVPYAPGGGNDTLARMLGRKLEELWRKPVIIENKAGGNTIIATESVSRLEPDGYTILMVTTIFSVNPSLVS